MGSFSVDFKRSAEKDLRKLEKKVVERIMVEIAALEITPYPKGSRKLQGAENLFRLRIGDYRVVYEISNEQKTVVIQHVRHRKIAYR